MAYSTLDDLKKKIDEMTLVRLTDTTGSGQIDEDKVARAIRDADALIDSYAGKVYAVPFSPAPEIIADISATLAVANLHTYRSLESPVWNEARERALALLEKVARGEVTLKDAAGGPAASPDISGAAMFSAAERRFSREKMKGM